MIHKYILGIVVLFTLSYCTPDKQKQSNKTIDYSIPSVKNIVVDGNLEDWENQGFHLMLNTNTTGITNANDFNADVKIGWNEQGLWLNSTVKDDTLIGWKRGFFNGDRVEIFISQKAGTSQMLQYAIPVGRISKNSNVTVYKYDFRISNPFFNVPDITTEVIQTTEGYTLEALIPLNGLDIPVITDSSFFVQLLFKDLDEQNPKAVKVYSWNYYDNTYLNNRALRKVVLSDKTESNKTIPVVPTISLIDGEMYDINIVADPIYAGKNLDIKIGEQTVYTGELEQQNGFSTANCSISADNVKNITDEFDFYVDGTHVYSIISGEVNFVFKNKKPTKPERFENDIRLYEVRCAENPPTENAILFLGSSSIRLWSSLEQNFKDYEVVKCGYGGSRTEDMLFYFDRVAKPFPYKDIVLFCGINDVNASIPYDTIIMNMEAFIDKTKTHLPETRILLLSNTVSVNKVENYDKIVALNELYIDMAGKYENVEYIDVFSPMLNEDRSIRPELYSGDKTHMNPDGYSFWTNTILPYLE